MSITLESSTVILDAAGAARVPVLLRGGAGIGKSSLLRSLAEARGTHLEVVIASVHEPADFNGMPLIVTDGDGSPDTVMAPPRWARRAAAAGDAWVVLDEINTAPPAVQAALLRVVLEHVVGEITLPEATRFIAAMNPVEIAAGGWELAPPLANRFLHLDVVADPEAWVAGMLSGWAGASGASLSVEPSGDEAAGVLSELTAFVAAHPALLHAMPEDPSLAAGAWPSPRSWDSLSRVLPRIPAADDRSRVAAAEGLVGRAAADAMFTWVEALDLPVPASVLADPGSVSWSDERGDRVAAILAGVCALVAAEPAARWEPAMAVLGAAAAAGREDLAATAVRPLVAVRPKGAVLDKALMARFAPLLGRAGKIS